MGKNYTNDIEFEKNRQEILKMAQKVSLNKIVENNTKKRESPLESSLRNGSKKSVWEYEIIEHRKKKVKEKFMMFGGICGIVSLIISVFLLLNLFYGFIK